MVDKVTAFCKPHLDHAQRHANHTGFESPRREQMVARWKISPKWAVEISEYGWAEVRFFDHLSGP